MSDQKGEYIGQVCKMDKDIMIRHGYGKNV